MINIATLKNTSEITCFLKKNTAKQLKLAKQNRGFKTKISKSAYSAFFFLIQINFRQVYTAYKMPRYTP
jgi:hypothetical protein